MENNDSAESVGRRQPKPAKQMDDDPIRFSTVYRMFEAKSAASKVEKGVTTRNRPPTNRLKPKKASVATMTEPAANDDDDDDVNDDDIHHADDTCGSSTFEQQTEIDADWLRPDDLSGSTNGKKTNEVSALTSGLRRGDPSGGVDRSAEGTTSKSGKTTGEKVTPNIPGTVYSHSDYGNSAYINSHGTPIITSYEQVSNNDLGVTAPTIKDDSWPVGVNATSVPPPPLQPGQAMRPNENRNQGITRTRTECPEKWGDSCNLVDDWNNDVTQTKSPTHQKHQRKDDYEESNPCRPAGSRTGNVSKNISSETSYEPVELYEDVMPSRRRPMETVSADDNKESTTRKGSASSPSVETTRLLGRDSSTYLLPKSTPEDQSGSNNLEGAVEKQEESRTKSAAGSQLAQQNSLRKSMSTSTDTTTEYLNAKTSSEFECQTDSNDDVSRPSPSLRDQSTDPEEDSLDKYCWYFGDADRELSEAILEHMINEPGSYLVRMSQRGGDGNPYTLSVVYQKRIYHLLIRQRRSDGMFSIGKEKHEEKVFFTVQDLITFYRNNFVELIGDAAKKTPSGKIQLKSCPPK